MVTKTLEDFIKLLLQKNILKNYAVPKNKIREIYDEEFKSKSNPPCSQFIQDLWYYWYIADITKKYVYFDQDWIIYLSKQKSAEETLKKKQLEEKNVVDKGSCRLCVVKFSNETEFKVHSESLKHRVRIQYLANKASFNRSEDITLKILEVNNVSNNNSSLSIKFEQKTNLNATLHLINNYKTEVSIIEIMQVNPLVTDLTMTTNYEKELTNLKSREHLVIVLNGYFENSASFVFPIVIVTKSANKGDMVHFLKEIKVEVTSEFSNLKSDTSYTKTFKRRYRQDEFDNIIKGKPPKPYISFYTENFPLLPYKIPPAFDVKLKALIAEYPGFIERSSFNVVNKVFHQIFAGILGIDPVLTENNYCDLLMALVHIEENQMKVDIRDFDTESSLRHRGANRYELEVPGLAEARPSLMVNDSVYVKNNVNDSLKYQGIVHDVLESAVILGFNNRFSSIFIENKKFHIEFGFNRRSVKVEKQAIALAKEHKIVSYFHPKQEPKITNNRRKSTSIHFFNPILNEEQKRAVKNILDANPVPYLIFGPPGTGKTVTVVEAILQIWKNQPDARVLVCAPSNAATNEIALRLVDKIPSTDLFRLVGNMYGRDAKLEKLQAYVNIKRDGSFYMPSMVDVLKFKVTLTTLVTAARIVNGGVPDGHYSHVFIDESGYATESQSLIPMAGILSNGSNRGKVAGQIVLAGDPMQLGPVIHSKFAEDCGYGISMLERLIQSYQIYARNDNNPIPYNEKYVTKLVMNYRSHRAILKTPNELFYHNELIPAENELSDVFTNWEHLKAPGFPVIFHHVVGEDRRERNSPSFYNIQEIEEVIGYISKLEGSRVKGLLINQDHIGVISPYRKQVEMLRRACKKRQWNNILVGSVEQFQGKEKLIIIVSTVRSKNTNKFEEIDKKCQLGFVRNPKRFNVAITRAKALLIVVGNALVLKNDKNWLNFIQHCVDNKSVVGRAFSLTDNEYLNKEIPGDSLTGKE